MSETADDARAQPETAEGPAPTGARHEADRGTATAADRCRDLGFLGPARARDRRIRRGVRGRRHVRRATARRDGIEARRHSPHAVCRSRTRGGRSDRREYEHLTEAFWYTLQTITTVGYGDVTPTDVSGRLVGAVVMLLGIASLSMLTATITSSFVEARQAGRLADAAAEDRATRASLEARLEEVIERLDRMEQRASRDAD